MRLGLFVLLWLMMGALLLQGQEKVSTFKVRKNENIKLYNEYDFTRDTLPYFIEKVDGITNYKWGKAFVMTKEALLGNNRIHVKDTKFRVTSYTFTGTYRDAMVSIKVKGEFLTEKVRNVISNYNCDKVYFEDIRMYDASGNLFIPSLDKMVVGFIK